MLDGDTQALTASRARLDAFRQQLLQEIRDARARGTPAAELAADAAALRHAAEQLLTVLQ